MTSRGSMSLQEILFIGQRDWLRVRAYLRILDNWLHGMYVLVAGFILFLIYNFLYCMHSKFQCVSEGVYDVHKYDSFGLERLIRVHVLVIGPGQYQI
jgi:hypothetical protein